MKDCYENAISDEQTSPTPFCTGQRSSVELTLLVPLSQKTVVVMSGISFSIKKTEASKVIKSQNADKDEEKKDYVLELEGKEIKR